MKWWHLVVAVGGVFLYFNLLLLLGGLRHASASISGPLCYKKMKFESGVHRVQRVPKTEKQGRMHTSTMTVAVLPQPTEVQQTDEAIIRFDFKIKNVLFKECIILHIVFDCKLLLLLHVFVRYLSQLTKRTWELTPRERVELEANMSTQQTARSE